MTSESAVQFDPTADPSTPAGGKSDEGANNAPSSSSNAAVAPEVVELIEKTVSKAFRGVQSMNTKLEQRMRTEFEAEMTKLQGMGINPDEAQAQKIYAETQRQVMEAESAGVEGNVSAQGQPPQTKRTSSDINKAATELMEKAGIEIDKADPEAAQIDRSSPLAYLDSVRSAIDAKRERLDQEATASATATTPTMSAVGGSVSPTVDNYQSEMMAARGSQSAVQAVKEKYRAKGLDVDHTPLFAGSRL